MSRSAALTPGEANALWPSIPVQNVLKSVEVQRVIVPTFPSKLASGALTRASFHVREMCGGVVS